MLHKTQFSHSCPIFCERLVNVICLLKDCRDSKFFKLVESRFHSIGPVFPIGDSIKSGNVEICAS